MRRRSLLEGVAGVVAAAGLTVGAFASAFSADDHQIRVVNQTDEERWVRVRALGEVFGAEVTSFDAEYGVPPGETVRPQVVDGTHRLVVESAGERDEVFVDGGMGGCTVSLHTEGVDVVCAA